MSPTPKYSIIIPVLNDAAALELCLRRVYEEPGISMEVLVVDGGSLDDTRIRVQTHYPRARLIQSSRGRGHQMNIGAAEARGNILVFLHADCILPRDWDEIIYDTMLKKNTKMVAFQLSFGSSEIKYRLLESCVEFRSRWLGLPYGDQGFVVHRDTFEQLNGFTEQALMEDVDFVRRVRKIGKVRTMSSSVYTSARNWRQDGFLRRLRINLTTLYRYFRSTPPDTLKSAYRGRKNAVMVFCKKPVPGKVKTRLAEGIGKAAAASFYANLVEKTLRSLLRRSRPYMVYVCFSPSDQYHFFLNWLGSRSAFLPQCEGDLGDRLAGAVKTGAQMGFTDIVLIGTDCPDLEPHHIETALIYLNTCDVVIGPANDGGYYLIAFHTDCPDLFSDITWSTDQVLNQTMDKIAQAGLSCRHLQTLRDVDTVKDLKRNRIKANQ